MNFAPTWRTAGEEGQPDIGDGSLVGVVDDLTGEVVIILFYGQETDGGQGYWIFGIPPGVVDYMQMNPNGHVETADPEDPDARKYVAVGILDRMRGEITCESDGVLWSDEYPLDFVAGSRVTITHVRR